MKPLFLDFDGVLNAGAYNPDGQRYRYGTEAWLLDQLDRDMAARVERICQDTGAVIVLSTSWRNAKLGWRALCNVVRNAGITAPVVGSTPEVMLPGGVLAAPRDEEIAEWVHWTGVTDFVVLDDFEMTFPPVRDRAVRTDPVVGITDADAERAIVILRRST